MIQSINEKDFAGKESETCLIDFYADWCPPCQMIAPVLEVISEKYKDEMSFYKINIDENIGIAQKYEITHVPTIIVLKNGKVANRAVGFLDEVKLADMIESTHGFE